MEYNTRYDNPQMRIIGKQNIASNDKDLETIQAIIKETEKNKDCFSLHELLFEACLDAFQAGKIEGIRSERARRQNKITE